MGWCTSVDSKLTVKKYPSVANYSQLSATGISLTSLSGSTLTTGWKFWQHNQVDTRIALLVGLPAMVSARVGTVWAKKLHGNTLALIFNAFSIVLIPTHFWIQERAKLRRVKLQETEQEATVIERTEVAAATVAAPQVVIQQCTKKLDGNKSSIHKVDPSNSLDKTTASLQLVSFGLFQGILSSLMGVGGLPLCMSFLTEFNDLDHHCVQGTAVCAVIPSLITSALSRIHAIPLGAAGAVSAGAIVGGYGGARLALALKDEQLRHLYMGSLLLFGGRSMVGAARNLRQLLRRY